MAVYKREGSPYWYFEFVVDGKRHRGSTGETSKAKALAAEAKARAAAQEDAKLGLDGMRRGTLGEVADLWLQHVSALTSKDHDNNITRVRKLFGERKEKGGEVKAGARPGLKRDLELQRLTSAMLVDLKESRIAEGIQPSTINRELALVQALLRYAKAKGYVTPRLEVGDLYEDEDDGKLRYLTVEEEKRLLGILDDRVTARPGDTWAVDQRDLAVLLLDTGARYTEGASLRWRDIDLVNGTINLYRSKVGNASNLKLTARALSLLRERRKRNPHGEFVFPSRTNPNTHRGYAANGIRTAIQEAGLNTPELVAAYGRVTVHTFRHTFASRLVQAGVPLFHVQALLGHSTPTMTQRYAHLRTDTASAQAAGVLDMLHTGRLPDNVVPLQAAA